MGSYSPDEMLVVLGFTITIDSAGTSGGIARFTSEPTDLTLHVLPSSLHDVAGTLVAADGTGSISGGFAAAADNWLDGNAFRYSLDINEPYSASVLSFRFYDKVLPGGPTGWLLNVGGLPVASGATHGEFTPNIVPLSFPELNGSTLIELIGTGATDQTAQWIIDDLIFEGVIVPEPATLSLVACALGAGVVHQLRRWSKRRRKELKVRVKPVPRLAVLLSDSGATLLNLAAHIRDGKLAAEIGIVICSRANAGGVRRAEQLGLPVHVLPRGEFDSGQAYSRALWTLIRTARVDLVCMGGFLPILEIPSDYEKRVLNIHPSLLPDFGGPGMYGLRVHDAVLSAGARETGCTVHYCDEQIDHGPVLLQRRCPVLRGDTSRTLAERVFREECLAYPEAIQLAAAQKPV